MASKINRQALKEEQRFELPVSMIDVVFLLLIFFMCVSKFRTLEHRLDANLPKDEGQNPIPKEIEKPEEIRVKMWEENDRLSILANQPPISNMTHLASTLKSLNAALGNLPVVIDARQNVKFKYVIGAIDACARAGISDVKFQAPPVPDGGGDDWWYK